ncbi:hypothetical protein BDA96_10G057700 [Sorghum bicolor]|uniref:Uncharacterized protein n=1 Tax=Sorghum bicolor TaxID=4558 RepID=A0A921TZQ4_SORBI|nr:hypothetical protein BDA96_10G057700 [Sorghum bicolor]
MKQRPIQTANNQHFSRTNQDGLLHIYTEDYWVSSRYQNKRKYIRLYPKQPIRKLSEGVLHLGVPQLQSRWNSQGNKEKTSS